jgi:hypothetical protein
LQQATEKQDVLEIIYEQDTLETQEKREHRNGLEQKFVGTHEKILKTAQKDEITTV